MTNFKELIKKFPLVWPLYWNNKFKKQTILYETVSGQGIKIVNSILVDDSTQIRLISERLKKSKNDDTTLECLRYVYQNIKYVSDTKNHLCLEYWQNPLDTLLSQSGDCEDGALLLMKILEYAGIPAWRRKICAGYVDVNTKKVGHAYVIYLADDFFWYPLDWCYWPMTCIQDFKRVPHHQRKEYNEVWFTFNEELMWSEHDYKFLQKKFKE